MEHLFSSLKPILDPCKVIRTRDQARADMFGIVKRLRTRAGAV